MNGKNNKTVTLSPLACSALPKTVKPSPLSNRGYERSEHPRRQTSRHICTLKGCPSNPSDVSFIILHTPFIQQSLQLIPSRDTSMMFFLIDEILSDRLLVSSRISQCTIPVLPTLDVRKTFRSSFHEIVGCNLQVIVSTVRLFTTPRRRFSTISKVHRPRLWDIVRRAKHVP